jgi:hypothetical protein
VSQLRLQSSHFQASPYCTSCVRPHSQLIVIGGPFIAPIIRPRRLRPVLPYGGRPASTGN